MSRTNLKCLITVYATAAFVAGLLLVSRPVAASKPPAGKPPTDQGVRRGKASYAVGFAGPDDPEAEAARAARVVTRHEVEHFLDDDENWILTKEYIEYDNGDFEVKISPARPELMPQFSPLVPNPPPPCALGGANASIQGNNTTGQFHAAADMPCTQTVVGSPGCPGVKWGIDVAMWVGGKWVPSDSYAFSVPGVQCNTHVKPVVNGGVTLPNVLFRVTFWGTPLGGAPPQYWSLPIQIEFFYP